MRLSFLIRSSAVAIVLVAPTVTRAQDIVMRRPLPMSRTAMGATDWRTTDWVILKDGIRVTPDRACGMMTEHRDVTCGKDGATVDDYFCSATPKPSSERMQRHDGGCTYAWSIGDWVDPGDACTLTETQERSVSCRRDGDLAGVDDAFCGQKPDTTREVEDFSTCSHSWTTGTFRDPGASCTNDERQDRDISCVRNLDHVKVADGECDAGTRPASSQGVRDISGCTYAWRAGAFVDPGSSCTRTETQTRDVACIRSLDAEVAADAACTGARPDATQMVADYGSCGYAAVQWSAYTFDSTCSATAKRTRTAKCQRSNDGGEIVADAECTTRGVALTDTSTVANHSTCSSSWATGDFVDPGASCTAAETQTRSVTCTRDLDKAVQDDTACAASTRPAASQQVADYSACGYDAANWSGWTPSSTCSAIATKTRTAQCRRSDGTNVAAANCTSRGVALSETVAEANYSTCSSSWVATAFVDPGQSCGNENQTRGVTCQRDLDHAVQADASCNAGTRPAATQTVYDVSGCGYAASAWSAWSYGSTCSASTTRTRTATCQRSDGQAVAAAECTTRGIATTQTENGVSNYTTCSSSWVAGAFVDPGQSCTSAETQTRGVTCQRDLDKAVQDDSLCSAATRPAATQAVADYSGCGYAATNWTAWTPSSTCSDTATKTRTAQCRRSDGTIVTSTDCTSRNIALAETVPEANYTTCSNSWVAGAFVDPGASCTSAETQTRPIQCKRDLDGAVQADTSCNAATRPGATQQVSDYSGCSYTAVNWTGYTPSSTCSATATKTRTAQCRRGDGSNVPSSDCTSRGVAVSETVSEANYTTCSNSWATGAFVDPGASCTSAETQTRSVWCKRDLDGSVQADAACSAGSRPAGTQQVADYSACTYAAHDHGYGACDGTNKPHYWDCRRSDGTDGFPASMCGHQNPEYENCYSYQLAAQPQSCSGGQQTVTNVCIRSDGQRVAASLCGKPDTYVQSCTSYSWQTGGYGAFGACQSDNRQYQYRDVYCEQRTGSSVSRADDSVCGGGKPASSNSQACEYYSYSVGPGWGWSDWMSHCSQNTYREQGHSCIRSPDGYVDNNYSGNQCTARGMVTYDREYAAVYDGCGYTPTYGGFGSCQSDSRQYQSMDGCYRSIDNASVPLNECTNRGQPSTRSQDCAYTPPTPVCAAGWGPERIIYSEDSSRGVTADQNAAGACTSGQGGTSASSKGNINECWTRATANYTLYGRYCGR